MFQGYSDETFEFFMALRFNNNTEFFHANHDWYKRAVREPSLALAEALGSVIEQIDDGLERRPNRVVSRINRDIRFSRDKSPYRDYLWLSFHPTGCSQSDSAGFYFDISAAGASFGMGYYRPERGVMNALRRRMVYTPQPLLDALAPIADYQVESESYRRMTVPDAVPEPLRFLYPTKTFFFFRNLTDFNLLKSPTLADVIAKGFHQLAPFYSILSSLVPEPDADITTEPKLRNNSKEEYI